MKMVCLCSGGIDSSVLLAQLVLFGKKKEIEVRALNFNYGSKQNKREYKSTVEICNFLDVKLNTMKLDFMNEYFESTLLLSGGKVPEGSYDEVNMESTVVPFRNGIMLSIAVGFALSIGFDTVAIAIHAGDHPIYLDCSKDFSLSMRKAIFDGSRVELITPFINFSKDKIISLGKEVGVPMRLTYSCYKGDFLHCGVCATCIERQRAFKDADVHDTTSYLKRM